jgi:hypothetical protein
LLREISGGGFALDRGVGRDDYFINVAGIDSRDEVRDAELFGSDAVQWLDGAV